MTLPVLSTFQAKEILAARLNGAASVRTSLDLNRSRTTLSLTESGVVVSDSLLGWAAIEEVLAEPRKVFWVDEGRATPIHVFSETTGWVRTLCPTASAPTVLVSGFPMHRIKGSDPMKDSEAKLRALGKVRGKVLDTATGLGYTAILASRSAAEVVTIELDPAALEIARFNPWSQELFSRSNIRQIVGDAFDEVPKLDQGCFAGVIHDPPTFALAGELYSGEFYRALQRVMKFGGTLFHYVGDPESAHGKKHYPGIMRRLHESGFAKTKVAAEAFGITALAG